MLLFGVLSEVLLYLCISIVMGTFLLQIVSSEQRPVLEVPRAVVLGSIIGVAIFSFHPVLRLIILLAEDYELFVTIQSVLFSFEVGKAWLLSLFISIVFFLYYSLIDVKKEYAYIVIGVIFSVLLVVAQGWSSHASTLSTFGFALHTIHFLAVSAWVGILLVVSWFARGKENWLPFLQWFSPLAIVCLLTVLLSGFFLMKLVVLPSEYSNSWALSYGQSLLIKHLFIVPLLAYAFINSMLVRKKIKQIEDFNPTPWSRVESIILLLVFSATAALGQQSPPHSINESLLIDGPSPLFLFFYNGDIDKISGTLEFGFYGVFLILVSLLFLSLIIISFMKRISPWLTAVFSVLFVFTSYLSFMLSVQ
ncbi:copper resistance D family protein [Bacillus suaedaesalsae]|uniref:CopD family protein n=1 Tax=Bacillus suaedaesalsae TaxID=2810349 RepID=A0ABS2DIZ4_9BACI|nr:CopD family protein [Bacillus suaedaesalsae]MBM6617970.1 CopD family protein [Bacillus suaedaesalsae]